MVWQDVSLCRLLTVAELINSKFLILHSSELSIKKKKWNFKGEHSVMCTHVHPELGDYTTPCEILPCKYQRRGLVQRKIKKISARRVCITLSQLWQWLWLDYQTHKKHNSTVSLFVVIWMWKYWNMPNSCIKSTDMMRDWKWFPLPNPEALCQNVILRPVLFHLILCICFAYFIYKMNFWTNVKTRKQG